MIDCSFFPTIINARVEDVPRAWTHFDILRLFRDGVFSSFSVFLCWWVEHSQHLFDECSDLCIGRVRGRPQLATRVKNKFRFLLDSHVRIAFVFIRRQFWLKLVQLGETSCE